MKNRTSPSVSNNTLYNSLLTSQIDILLLFEKKADGALKKNVKKLSAEALTDFINGVCLDGGLSWLKGFSNKFNRICKKSSSATVMYLLFTSSLLDLLSYKMTRKQSKIDKSELDEFYIRLERVTLEYLSSSNKEPERKKKDDRTGMSTVDSEKSIAELHQMFNAITDPFFVVDKQMRVIKINRYLHDKMRANKGTDIIGKTVTDVVCKGESLCKKSDVEEVLSNGQPKISHIHLNTSNEYYIQYLYPIMAEGGEVTAVLIFNKDLTEHKTLEEEIQHLGRLATIGRLSTIVAHEIRNPLSGIGLSASLLKKKLSKDWAHIDSIENILEGIDKIESFILRLLDFSKPRKSKKRSVNIIDAINEALFFIRARIFRESIQLIEDYPQSLPKVYVDPDQLMQVFMNLFLNAIQSMQNGGQITVQVSAYDDRTVIVSISDTGEGIKKADLPHIFEPFFTTKTDGTGLGLTISKKILMQNNIKVSVRSKVSKGTEFTLTIGAHHAI